MTDEGKAAKKKTADFLKKHTIHWPCGYGSQVTKEYKVTGWPTLFVIGADGKVAWNDYQPGDLAGSDREGDRGRRRGRRRGQGRGGEK